MFLYRGSHVSAVRFQVVQMTAPYDVEQYFSAWGVTAAGFTPGVAHLSKLRQLQTKSEAARLPERSWSALKGVADPSAVDAFNSYSDVIESAAVVNGKLYRSDCPTSAGPFPYCSDVRYGVWSVTKSAMLNVAMMRLAQKYGRWILNAPIARYVPEARTAGWRDVTIGDLANMASGHGPAGDPTCYLCDYSRWYLAPSEKEKTAQALDYPRFTEPGTLYNYRDQDAYLLGVAEEKLLQAKEGRHADVWRMVRDEVYRPIGIYQAPTNMTVDPDSVGPHATGHPLMAYGYYPTLDDLAKIAALYESHGAWKGRQILNPTLVNRLLPTASTPAPQALAGSDDGSHWYLTDWHLQRIESSHGCTRYLPTMLGWGGNSVTLLPGKVTLIRMRNNWVGDPTDPQIEVNALADALSPICGV
jgi:CubicO group peptidase (beta-lactamase class C family)